MESVPVHLRYLYGRALVDFARSCAIEEKNTLRVHRVERAVGRARFSPCPCFARTLCAKHDQKCWHADIVRKPKCDFCANECEANEQCEAQSERGPTEDNEEEDSYTDDDDEDDTDDFEDEYDDDECAENGQM